MRAVARAFAISLSHSAVRAAIRLALQGSRAREHKLQVQRYFANRGAWLLPRIDIANGLASGRMHDLLRELPDLEIYLPDLSHRESWRGDPEVLVVGRLETDVELHGVQGSAVPGYSVDGAEHSVSTSRPAKDPVIVLVPAEMAFGPDGETGASPAEPEFVIEPECPPDCPPPPVDPCAANPIGKQLIMCRVQINNVSQYEGWLRGSPEVVAQLFSVLPNGTGFMEIGCANEGKVTPLYYDQNGDSWEGAVKLGDSTAIKNATNAGRSVSVVFWEDDTGAKCTFNTTEESLRNLMGVGGYAALLTGLSWFNCTNCPTPGTVLGGWGAWAILNWILSTDDDAIGAARLPSTSAPSSKPWNIARTLAGNVTPSVYGTLWVVTRP